jgi:alginate O-acetyltransferase complex protein AlgJ
MQRLFKLSRYLLPVVFFGCAAVANTGLPDVLRHGPGLAGLFQGKVTAQLDTDYKGSMPHRSLSIGLIGAARYAVTGEGRAGVISGPDGWLFTGEEARPLMALDESLTQIAHLRDALAAQGVALVMVPLPAKIDVHADRADMSALSHDMTQLYGAFLDGLAAKDVPAIDTRHALMSGAGFLQTDTHWSVEGASRVAAVVAASGLIPVGAETLRRVDAPVKEITGDLVSYVTTDQLAPMLGLGRERIRPFLAEFTGQGDAVDIFAPSTTAVALVGTSYSANPDWSFAEALKLATRQDIINHAEEGRGPVAPMRDFLATVGTGGPTTVLWEFPIRYLTDPTLWKKGPDHA